MEKSFEKFSVKECLKTNIKTIIFFIITLMVTIIIEYIIFKVTFNSIKKLDNTFADLILIVLFLFFILIVLVIYSIIVTLKVKIYESFIDNIKSLSSLAICNSIFTIFLLKITTLSLACIYIGTIFIASSISFIIRYYRIKLKK